MVSVLDDAAVLSTPFQAGRHAFEAQAIITFHILHSSVTGSTQDFVCSTPRMAQRQRLLQTNFNGW